MFTLATICQGHPTRNCIRVSGYTLRHKSGDEVQVTRTHRAAMSDCGRGTKRAKATSHMAALPGLHSKVSTHKYGRFQKSGAPNMDQACGSIALSSGLQQTKPGGSRHISNYGLKPRKPYHAAPWQAPGVES